MKRVLVTGADGFIGSHLVDYLLNKKLKVKALSQYNSFNNWGWLDGREQSDNLEIVTGDIRDPFFCESMAEGVDTIFHLAALIAIPYSYVAPAGYVDTNINGTLNILQAAKRQQVKKLIITSTSEVYGTALYVPIDEKHPKQPQSPYSASKIGADAMAMSYYNSFGLPVCIARPFNTYGPRQSARAIIPSIITQIASGKSEIMLGDLRPTRDFNYVKDVVRAFYSLAQSDTTIGKEINISTNSEYSIERLVDMIMKLMNRGITVINSEERIRPPESEVLRLWGDNTLIRGLTDWKPEYSIEKGLIETIEWFMDKDNLNRYKADIYNI